MKLLKHLIAFLSIASLLLVHIQHVSAHKVIYDTSSKLATVLHIEPEDYPIAGKTSAITYEFNEDVDMGKLAAKITLTLPDGTTEDTVMHVSGRNLTGTYLFKYQGSYQLRLELIHTDTRTSSTFVSTENVVRGTGVRQSPSQLLIIWFGASTAVLVCLGALVLLGGKKLEQKQGQA